MIRSSRYATFLLVALILSRCEQDQNPDPDSATSSGAWFVDVAREAGIDFVHEAGARGDFQLPEIMGSGCAWIDYDLDGDLDAYLISAGRDPERSRNRLFRNELAGPGGTLAARFTDVTEASGAGDAGFGMGAAVGDYDGDGAPDIYVTNFGANKLYRNEGDGTFKDVTEASGVGDPRWGASAAFVDIDADGDLDLFVTNYMKHPPCASDHCIDASGRVEYCSPNTRFPPERDTLYHNLGDGRFEDITAAAGLATRPGNGLGVGCADFNGDGLVDIYVANDAWPNHLWINQGNRRFVERGVDQGLAYNMHGLAEAGMGVQAIDIDGDGPVDVLVTHLAGETNTLYRQIGAGGHFEDITFRTGLAEPGRDRTAFGMAFFDADHDGDLDLVVTNGRVRRGPRFEGVTLPAPWDLYAEADQFFEHVALDGAAKPSSTDGPWGFRFVDRSRAAGPAFAEPHLGRGLAVGDYDGDGDLDVLVTSCAGRARLLRNDAPRRGHWLMVQALRRGGRGAVYGAHVTVRAGDTEWRRTVQPAYGYLSSNDPRLHFGLGEATSASVSVRWTDGAITELEDVAVDRVVTISR